MNSPNIPRRVYRVDRPCPALSEALASALVEVPRGGEFEIVTNWESAIEDVRSWARIFKAEVLRVWRDSEGWVHVLVKLT